MPKPATCPPATSSVFPQEWLEEWTWGKHKISVAKSKGGDNSDSVVLIHGFGACKEHWRHNVAPLAEQFDVAAIDLLGFGSSDKPQSRLSSEPEDGQSTLYCIDLWG